jgi:hypothetical protein
MKNEEIKGVLLSRLCMEEQCKEACELVDLAECWLRSKINLQFPNCSRIRIRSHFDWDCCVLLITTAVHADAINPVCGGDSQGRYWDG